VILQSLYQYYARKAETGNADAAPQGFQWKQLPFLIVITSRGQFVRLEDTREGTGKKRAAKRFLVPIAPIRPGNTIRPGLLWDQLEYAIGANPRARSDIALRFGSFQKRIKEELGMITHPSLAALVNFLETNPVTQISRILPEEEWSKFLDENPFVAFRLEGEQPLIDMLFDKLPRPDNSNSSRIDGVFCPVSGERGQVPSTHSKVIGVWGAQSVGASLVSFNSDAYESYGKTQNQNAQMCEAAADAYTKALNMLLDKGSKNRVQVGDASTVFWSDRTTQLEKDFLSFWSIDKDDPDRGIIAVESLLKSPYTGAAIPDGDSKFFVLGLAPNAARIAVRFWHPGTVAEFSDRLRRHFLDLEIIKPKADKGNCALFFLLSDIALENKVDNIPPNIAGNTIRAILSGGPYPTTLLQQAMRRIRATRQVKRTQAALLKACLNRAARHREDASEEEIRVSLDTCNNNPGYRLGRLFAVLEKIQEDAQPGINATIRDRFYGAASSSPVSVFPQLLKLKNHHLAKLENPAFRVAHEKRLTEIFSGLSADMPAHLSMEDQARFAIGYYHQRQALFTKSPPTDSTPDQGNGQ